MCGAMVVKRGLLLCLLFLQCECQEGETDERGPVFGPSLIDFVNSRHIYAFWIHFASYIRDAKYVTVINAGHGDSCLDVQNYLIATLSTFEMYSIFLVDFKTISDWQRSETHNRTAQKLLNYKQTVIELFESRDAFHESLYNKNFSVFIQNTESFYIIVITSTLEPNINCEDLEESLKSVTGELFMKTWNLHKVLEIVIFLPFICGTSTVVKFDPIMSAVNDDAASGVRFITERDFSVNPKAMMNSYRNLNGYPLEVKAFKRIPTLVKDLPDSLLSTYMQRDIDAIHNVGGIDGFLLGNMAKKLNFTPRISESADGIEYGYRASNGTFTGTIGDVISRKADIAMNGRFLKDYGAEGITFTSPFYYENFCVLAPKALRIPSWMNIFQSFSPMVWNITIATVIFCGLVWCFMKSISTTPVAPQGGFLFYCFHCMDSTMLIASQPIFLPTLGRERIFIASCLIFNIIFSGVFQGYLNTAFSTISHYPDIDTLEALDESGLLIASSSGLDDIFGTGVSRILTNLQKKVRRVKTAAIDTAAFKRDVTAVERRSDARLLIELKYVGSDGEPLLHIVNECPRSYYLAYIVYKGYPFLGHMDRFMRFATEAGLNYLWYDITVYSIVLAQRSKSNQSSESLKKLSLVDVQTAFFALAVGMMIAFIVMLTEWCFYHIKNRKSRKRGKVFSMCCTRRKKNKDINRDNFIPDNIFSTYVE